jgi:hypothetical protein
MMRPWYNWKISFKRDKCNGAALATLLGFDWFRLVRIESLPNANRRLERLLQLGDALHERFASSRRFASADLVDDL